MIRLLWRPGIALGLGWLIALLAPTALAGPTPTPTPADDVQDLLFLGGPHPLFIRLHVRAGDLPLHAAWRDAIGKLSSYLDTDGDGTLTLDEAARVDWPRLARVFQNFRPPPEFRLPSLDSGLQDGIITTEELAEFARAIRGPLLLQVRPPSRPDTETTFARLDTNGDGALARDELGRAADVLRMLDQNDDETISLAELSPFRNPIFGSQSFGRPNEVKGDSEPPVVLLGPNESRTRLVQQLLRRFDTAGPDGSKTKDRRLGRAELGLGSEVFAAFDGDGDETLDSDELMQLLDRRDPALEVIVRLGGSPSKPPTVEVVGREDEDQGRPDRAAARVRMSGESSLTLEMGDVWIELRSEDRKAEFDRTRRQLHAQWEALDKDKDKTLSFQESEGQEPLRSLFPFMDRDSDSKVDGRELIAALDLLDELARGHALLEVADRGGSLFGSLDTGGDGRLGLRELRAADQRLASFDRDGDGRVAPEEIPRRFEWVLSQAPLSAPVRNRPVNQPLMQTEPVAKGPPWFQKMDRNRDGDLSPREFLGPRAEFRRLDANGDGLIDDREAKETHPHGDQTETLRP